MADREILDNITIVLSHTSHPGNIGAAARAMKTMGLYRLALLNPRHFPDAEATARASGATDVLEQARVYTNLDEALAGNVLIAGLTARRRDLSHDMVNAREGAQELVARARTQPVACLFGTEMSGLSNAELEKCQLLVNIPANPDYSSLNLAAAVQVMSYELRMSAGLLPPPMDVPPLAEAQEVEQFYTHLEQVLQDIHFLNPRHPKRLMLRIRRLLSRSRLEKEEVQILRGILKAIQQRS